MISLVLIVLLVSLASIDCQAQQQWTLRQCMDYAIEHNISIKQQDNVRRQQELSLSTSRNSRLPDLSASASENYSFGRAQTLDGTYSNRNTNSTSFSIGTSVPLFTGLRFPIASS